MEILERLTRESKVSIDAALYRFNSQRLAHALDEAQKRGTQIRVVVDRNKYEESIATRDLLSDTQFPFRITYGRDGSGSKMHHKFVIFDHGTVATGSYNWTFASEERNHENLLILRESKIIEAYRAEFEALWENSQHVEIPNLTSGPII